MAALHEVPQKISSDRKHPRSTPRKSRPPRQIQITKSSSTRFPLSHVICRYSPQFIYCKLQIQFTTEDTEVHRGRHGKVYKKFTFWREWCGEGYNPGPKLLNCFNTSVYLCDLCGLYVLFLPFLPLLHSMPLLPRHCRT